MIDHQVARGHADSTPERAQAAEDDAAWLRFKMAHAAEDCRRIADLIEMEAISGLGDGLKSPDKLRVLAESLRREVGPDARERQRSKK